MFVSEGENWARGYSGGSSSDRNSGGYSGSGDNGARRHSHFDSGDLHIGLVVPYKSFGTREYTKAVTSAIAGLTRKLTLFRSHELKVHLVMKELTPSPTSKFCFFSF